VSRSARLAALFALVALAVVVANALAASPRPHPANAAAQAFARQDPAGARHDFVSVNGAGDTAGDETRVTASTNDGKGRASAAAAIEKVNVFDGLVTADEVRVRAAATEAGTSTSGAVLGLAIAGTPKAAPDGRTVYDLNGYGEMVALGSGATGVLGLRVHLSKDYKDHKAGSVVRIAYASAKAHDAVSAPAAQKQKTTAEPAKKKQAAKKKAKKKHKKSAKQKLEDGLTQRERDWAAALLQRPGYAFPVAGEHNFADTFGAPRADTITHVGVDIFANYGTPIVAAADGRLYRVGTLKISGNRVWLRDSKGYRYFYAHLSDFAAASFNGADVKAGEIIGFIGSTGDAEQTPPHLHFEVHMPDGAVVDPTPYVQGWDGNGVKYTKDPGARPGALVVVRDFLAEG
jgi:murein DD-endopeptidase MepM/ murein hydrolase activator NlpD